MKKRWWHRYKVQALLSKRVTNGLTFGFDTRYFITHKNAEKFQLGLYKDFGPGHVIIILEKIRGTLRTEMS